MPETADFEKIARAIIIRWGLDDPPSQHALIVEDMAEQLRLVWNARGAADIVKLTAELSTMMGSVMAAPYVKNLDRSLRTLDR